MNKYILAGAALLPLLVNCSHAAQMIAADPSDQPWGYSSEDSGTGAYLGVDVADVTTERLSALKLKEEKGVEITMVDQDAPAGKAGVHEHDVILSMNGTAIESGAQLRRMIHETPPGRVVTLGLSRDGQPLTIKVQLGDKHKEFSMVMPKSKNYSYSYSYTPPIPPVPNIPDIEIPEINVMVVRSSARSGLMVENLTGQLGEYFGVKDGNGVLVRSVEKGSRADKAGLKAGDVIVKVNDDAVHDTDDFTRALRSRNGGQNTVNVIRDKKEQTLNLVLPEHKGSESYSSGNGDGGSSDLQEESFDDDDVDFDAKSIEMSELTEELAQLQPQINFAQQWQKEVRNSEKAKKNYQVAQKHALRAQCSQQHEVNKQLQKLQPQMKRQQREFERLQHEMQGDWTEI